MNTSIYKECYINKASVAAIGAAVILGLSGCSTNTAVPNASEPATSAAKVSSNTANASRTAAQQAPRPAVAAQPPRQAGKDQHQLALEAKRQSYHDRWQREQLAKERELEKRRLEYAAAHLQRQQVNARQQAEQQRLLAQRRQQLAQQNQYAVAHAQRAYLDYSEHLSNAALERTRYQIRYDGSYIPIAYPMGDVPANIGVCTDTVIRSYRRLGIDLQQLVHEDMSRAFHVYPNLAMWGLRGPDPNIDHRRVHNLKVFFTRHGQRLPVTHNPENYRPGDLVTWSLGGGQEHIGIVVNQRSPADPRRFMIVHNIADGDKLEDVLFTMPITGHFRFFPQHRQQHQHQHPQLLAASY